MPAAGCSEPWAHSVLISPTAGDSCLGSGAEVIAGDRMVREQYCPVSDAPFSGEAAWMAFWLAVALGLATAALHSLGSGCGSGTPSQDRELLECSGSCLSNRTREILLSPKIPSGPHLQSQSHFFS